MIYSRFGTTDTMLVYPDAIKRALEFLGYVNPMTMPLGRHEIEGDRMYVTVMDMTTHPFEGSHPEVHQRYIDLMYWPEGGERLGFAPYLGTEKLVSSDPEKDVSFLESVENESFLTTTAGDFALFFPWDAHRPGLMLGDAPATSRKLVIKIRMDLL